MKTVVLMSGGMDSTTLLYRCMEEGHVWALSFDYGQKHIKELAFAQALLVHAGVRGVRYNIPALDGSALTSPDVPVPEGHYEDKVMEATVVPNRNMIFLAVAAWHAERVGAERVAFAAHAGDYAIYPDCRPGFVDAMQGVLAWADSPIEIYAPYLGMTKADIVAEGATMGVPYEMTWTCYKGGDRHCGKCGACQERREAFELADVDDPTRYDATN